MVLGFGISDILFVLASIIALEGAACVVAPNFVRNVARFCANLSNGPLRVIGLIAFAIGAIILWEIT